MAQAGNVTVTKSQSELDEEVLSSSQSAMLYVVASVLLARKAWEQIPRIAEDFDRVDQELPFLLASAFKERLRETRAEWDERRCICGETGDMVEHLQINQDRKLHNHVPVSAADWMSACTTGFNDALSCFRALDTNQDGVIDRDNLKRFLKNLSLSDSQIEPLLLEVDEREWVRAFDAINCSTARLKFRDLEAHNGGDRIADIAFRAISLEQLEKLYEHVRRRLRKTKWKVKRESGNVKGQWREEVLGDLKNAKLFDLVEHVIQPATFRGLRAEHCSIVELMATWDQQPDFFTSYW